MLEPKIKEPAINSLLEELSFEQRKREFFKLHLDKLFHMMSTDRSRFNGYILKKPDELIASLWRGGTKVITLFNDEVQYHENSETVDLIRNFMEQK
jgi:hypothetical protein